jgi:hypothetical protein
MIFIETSAKTKEGIEILIQRLGENLISWSNFLIDLIL